MTRDDGEAWLDSVLAEEFIGKYARDPVSDHDRAIVTEFVGKLRATADAHRIEMLAGHAWFCSARFHAPCDCGGTTTCACEPPGPCMHERAREMIAARADRRAAVARAMPIEDKVRHVRRAGQSRAHGCHWPGCEAQVPPAKWGCTRHWFMLPKHLRDLIWREYRPGQEATMSPSRAYMDVVHKVDEWIAQHEQAEAERASSRRDSNSEHDRPRALAASPAQMLLTAFDVDPSQAITTHESGEMDSRDPRIEFDDGSFGDPPRSWGDE